MEAIVEHSCLRCQDSGWYRVPVSSKPIISLLTDKLTISGEGYIKTRAQVCDCEAGKRYKEENRI